MCESNFETRDFFATNRFGWSFDAWHKAYLSPIYQESNTTSSASEGGGDWGYSGNNGPDKWPSTCHYGKHQSPINIDTRQLLPEKVPRLHFVNYNRTFENIFGENIGRGVLFTGFSNDKHKAPYVYGGGLPGKYLLYQFHFHWSRRFSNGSEHTINFMHYPVEIHMVHIREDLTLEEAYNATDGVAVLAIFGVFDNEGKALKQIAPHFEQLQQGGDNTTFNFIPGALLPENKTMFYHYEGSLTTPGCFETVDWLIFHEPISITHSQLDELREVQIIGRPEADARPTQPINDRHVSDCAAVLSGDH
ncbi:eukaryotic-type carbonic anhydrase domain-containing protein [Ditylenchus destructor]|nr:eukaryotic-type carbonic anhydrase domain-containing protein [Ditylenchus destructor]